MVWIIVSIILVAIIAASITVYILMSKQDDKLIAELKAKSAQPAEPKKEEPAAEESVEVKQE